MFAKLRSTERQQEYLVWSVHPEVFHLKEDKLNRVRVRGGTESVKAPLASLSSVRQWEWLSDPLLTLVRQRNLSH